MVEPDHSIWRKVLAHLKTQHPDVWRQWFEEIEPLSLVGGVFRLRVIHPVQLSYLRRACVKAFTEAAQAVTDRLITVVFLGPVDEAASPEELEAAPSGTNGASSQHPSSSMMEARPGAQRRRDDFILIPDHSFENFVMGPGNRLALAAAVAVAEAPGERYNPFFVHGGVGLGKTHLLQAICQKILTDRPQSHIVYISCEEFVTRFMDAVQAGHMADFRHQFRDVDVLVIDDIHFLTRRQRTQDEFFHTFNTLHQSARQIILSSDAPPDEIPDLEDRLVSRFKWGLVAGIEPPDYDTRVAIVKQKAKVRGVEAPDDVCCLIAQRFDSNIRELEGALTKVQMQHHIDGGKITLEMARRALGVEATSPSTRATIETIVNAVTNHFDVTLANLQSKRRQRSIAQPRQMCMYLARQYTRYSLEEIGGYFGGRDHTTVLHAVRTITALRQRDPEIERALNAIESRLQVRGRD